VIFLFSVLLGISFVIFPIQEVEAAPGDFIVTDFGGRLLSVTAGGTVTPFASGLGIAVGVAIDSGGNFIVTDSIGRLLSVTTGGTVTEIPITSELGSPAGIAIDSGGNFIVTDSIGGRLLSVTAGGTVTEIPITSGLGSPFGVAIEGTVTTPPEVTFQVEVVQEFRGQFGDDDAVFRFLGVQVTDDTDPNPTVGDVTLNGEVLQAGDLLRLELDDEFEVEEDDEFALRMEAPEFIFSVTASDASGNSVTVQTAILVEDFAGADLDVDEVVSGTENQRGTPVDDDSQEEFDDNVQDLLDDGFVNPSGIPSAIVTS